MAIGVKRLHAAACMLLLLLVLLAPLSQASYTLMVVGEASLIVPAVTTLPNGTFAGVTSHLEVRAVYPGTGRVFFATEPLTEIDTQAAARIAALIASVYAGVDPLRYDWLVRLVADTPMVGGPSASAATALAMYAALTGRRLPRNMSLTGMINVDGSIGPVGGIPEKLEAVAQAGVKLFFIPKGEEVTYVTKRVVRRQGPFIITEEVRVPINVTELGAKLGVHVEPVASFAELLHYAFGVRIPNATIRPPVLLQMHLKSVAENYLKEAEGNMTLIERLSRHTPVPVELSDWFNDRLGRLKKLVNETKLAISRKMFYVAASDAFQAAIYAYTLYSMLEILSKHSSTGSPISELIYEFILDNGNVTKRILDTVEARLEELVKARDVNALQIALAVYNRLLMAHDTLVASRQLVETNPIAALENSVYSYYRARSCLDWLKVYRIVGEGVKYDIARLQKTVSMFTGFAETLVTYLENLGVANEYLTIAIRILNKLKEASERGAPYPFRLQLAIDAIAYASMALHAEYGTAKLLYPASRETAALLYERVSRARIQPLLAASYVEAGDADKDPISKLAMYTRASAILLALYVLAGIGSTKVPAVTVATSSSTIVTVTETMTLHKVHRVTETVTTEKLEIVKSSGGVTVGFAAGTIIGFAVGVLTAYAILVGRRSA